MSKIHGASLGLLRNQRVNQIRRGILLRVLIVIQGLIVNEHGGGSIQSPQFQYDREAFG